MMSQQKALHEPKLPIEVKINSAPAGTLTVDAPSGVMEIAPSWHEQVYHEAAGDISRIKWAEGRPNPMLISWLNAEAPGLIRPGGRVVVVGCGLGDDVAELADRGYDVQGFDIAPTAINWARNRFSQLAKNLLVADLFNLPTRLRHRFDLVVEVYTLQSVHPSMRERAAESLASLVTPHGVVLTICRGRDESELLDYNQPAPWALTVSELTGLMEARGLRPIRNPDDFMDDETPPKRRVRAAFSRV
jgi:SAM-dependent methyltransferase